MDWDDPNIGAHIREARLQVVPELTLEELARRARCSRNYIAGLERGMRPGGSSRARGSVERILMVLALAMPSEDEPDTVDDEAHA